MFNCLRTIVRRILKLSVKFRNCPANLEIVRQISKIVRQKKNCPRIPRTTDNFENCPLTIVVRQFPKTPKKHPFQIFRKISRFSRNFF
jgi:hypothetical protein